MRTLLRLQIEGDTVHHQGFLPRSDANAQGRKEHRTVTIPLDESRIAVEVEGKAVAVDDEHLSYPPDPGPDSPQRLRRRRCQSGAGGSFSWRWGPEHELGLDSLVPLGGEGNHMEHAFPHLVLPVEAETMAFGDGALAHIEDYRSHDQDCTTGPCR